MRKPFLYICSLRRTGSTMLAELLSDLPACFVFREPRLVKGRLRAKKELIPLFDAVGIDIIGVKRAMRQLDRPAALAHFKAFVEGSAAKVAQFGIKEIYHSGFETISELFPDMKVIVTARDPRDIFLSLYHRRKKIEKRGKRWFDPDVLLEYLRAEFERQKAMIARHAHLKVRYEDFCSSPETLESIRVFAECESRGTGLLGKTYGYDFQKHSIAVDASRTELWKRETDEIALHNAAYVFEGMREYAEYWGYTAR